MKFHLDIVAVKNLRQETVETMFYLMNEYYDNLNRDKFIKDLEAKDGVLLVFDPQGHICGFTTYVIFETVFYGERTKALFSGDTVLQEKYWGKIETARIFLFLLRRYLSKEEKFYWFLLTKGIRTYKLLPMYFKKYYPSVQTPTPVYEKALIAHLSKIKYGDFYLKKDGIIRNFPPADRLKEKYLTPAQYKLGDEHASFFIKNNPGYADGDELPCVAQISWDNLTAVSQKWLNNEQHELTSVSL